MQIKEAAERLGITERMLRHYEKAGLIDASRSKNGYRSYTEADLQRAGRIRDMIATGFSTREAHAMAACLSDEAAGPCKDGIPQLLRKTVGPHAQTMLRGIERVGAQLTFTVAGYHLARLAETARRMTRRQQPWRAEATPKGKAVLLALLFQQPARANFSIRYSPRTSTRFGNGPSGGVTQ